MKFEQHCAICATILGEPFEEVNRWLDELAWVESGAWVMDGKQFDPTHRQHRHHREGIEQVRARWGDRAARAAVLHVMLDLGLKSEDDIPANRQEYLRYFA